MAEKRKGKEKQICMTLPAEILDRVREVAARESNSVASVVRRLLSEGIAREAAK